ncbi:MAG: hypothetical protein PARBB_02667 [Parabacteroides distasonis]
MVANTYMKEMKIIILLSLVFFIGCSQSKTPSSLSAPYIIDFEQCMNTERTMRLSEIADTIEFLELKTPKDTIITSIWDFLITKEFLLVFSRDGVYKFTKEGDFIKQVGRTGQGPGEYTLAVSATMNHVKREIVISDVAQKIIFYDFDGNFLREEKWGHLRNIGYSDSILWISDYPNNMSENNALALNQNRDTLASIPNPHYGMKSKDGQGGFSSAKYLRSFYVYNDNTYLSGNEESDTVYQLSGKDYTPYIAFNKGKYKLPMEYEVWYSYDDHERFGSNYWNVITVAEDDRYLFLTCLRTAPLAGKKYGHYEENYSYIVYDKEKKTAFKTGGEKGTKIIDDIMGGPAIWPRYVTDDYYMYTKEWYNLSEEIKNGNYNLAPALKEQFKKFGYSTNELIVMCRKKKQGRNK